MTSCLIDPSSWLDLIAVPPLIGSYAINSIAPPLYIRSTFTHPAAKRVPIKHLLLGSPPAVSHTIHRLHQLCHADADL